MKHDKAVKFALIICFVGFVFMGVLTGTIGIILLVFGGKEFDSMILLLNDSVDACIQGCLTLGVVFATLFLCNKRAS